MFFIMVSYNLRFVNDKFLNGPRYFNGVFVAKAVFPIFVVK